MEHLSSDNPHKRAKRVKDGFRHFFIGMGKVVDLTGEAEAPPPPGTIKDVDTAIGEAIQTLGEASQEVTRMKQQEE